MVRLRCNLVRRRAAAGRLQRRQWRGHRGQHPSQHEDRQPDPQRERASRRHAQRKSFGLGPHLRVASALPADRRGDAVESHQHDPGGRHRQRFEPADDHDRSAGRRDLFVHHVRPGESGDGPIRQRYGHRLGRRQFQHARDQRRGRDWSHRRLPDCARDRPQHGLAHHRRRRLRRHDRLRDAASRYPGAARYSGGYQDSDLRFAAARLRRARSVRVRGLFAREQHAGQCRIAQSRRLGDCGHPRQPAGAIQGRQRLAGRLAPQRVRERQSAAVQHSVHRRIGVPEDDRGDADAHRRIDRDARCDSALDPAVADARNRQLDRARGPRRRP